ncbi:hypothetical protein [Reyranella sp.]|uniref:hypothetical protein n=1 Tax=Reyranella sp. TaxID=1929291 RepID=UPI003784DF44
MGNLIDCLRPNERRGSKPRCHLLTHGSREQVAAALTELAAPFARVAASDRWMPDGFVDLEEAQLHRAPRLVSRDLGEKLRSWWLAPASVRARTPNFDIASTCTFVDDDKPGLLLVEAKAHDEELGKESGGRLVGPGSSEDSKASHDRIGACVDEARQGLEQLTALPWSISRDFRYQMSNRFAWAWKLASSGVPVVLIYLGFLRADEMRDKGKPFADADEWECLVRGHSAHLVPPQAWGRKWGTAPTMIVPLIRSQERSLEASGWQAAEVLASKTA